MSDRPFPTRIEAEPEGNAVVISVYAHMLQMTVELSPADGRQLAAGILDAVALTQESYHVED